MYCDLFKVLKSTSGLCSKWPCLIEPGLSYPASIITSFPFESDRFELQKTFIFRLAGMDSFFFDLAVIVKAGYLALVSWNCFRDCSSLVFVLIVRGWLRDARELEFASATT